MHRTRAALRVVLAVGTVTLAGLLGGCSHGTAIGPMPAAGRPAAAGTLSIHTAHGRVSLVVRLAATEAQRRRGLMGVRAMGPDRGMAFLYARPVRQAYWMKDTLIPLSIAFWGSDHRIVAMLDMVPCRAEQCPLYDPKIPFAGAVEANRGFFAAHGIRVGDTVELAG